MTIGERMRKIRRRQGRTLQEIAGRCGFSRSLLSKIETGRTSPPVATLMKIAGALGVKASAFMEEADGAATVHTPAERAGAEGLVKTEKGYSFHSFAAGRPDKLMQPYRFVAQKGKVKPGALSHRGEEFVYVLEGKMKYRVGRVEYMLSAGDSLYFDAEEEHDLDPVSKEVSYLAVFCERP